MSALVEEIDYTDLYRRWERGQWSAGEIDFAADRRDWADRMDERQRRAALWTYTLFLHGEHAVAESLGPFIDAAPEPEHKYFLATQQADEARHSVLFTRFMREVVESADTTSAVLERTRPALSWGFRRIFGRLDDLTADLRRDPSLPNLAAAVTMYHLIVEATLAQPGQRIVEHHLERSGLLPGLLAGMRRVSADEQRHIGFGVKLLADLTSASAACRDRVVEVVREAIPWVTAVFVPPGWDEEGYFGVLGFSMEDVYEEGMRSFESKLRAAGLQPETLHGAVPWPMGLSPRKRAERALLLLRGNTIGERLGPPARDPETVRVHFETLARAVDDRRVPPRRLIVQWDFDDLEPWHLRIEGGAATSHRGGAHEPDVVLRCRYDDWIDVAAGREHPIGAMLRRRIRPSGAPRSLRYLPRLFG